jgi:predicted lipoprotein with Yx(FWY)xxD motif
MRTAALFTAVVLVVAACGSDDAAGPNDATEPAAGAAAPGDATVEVATHPELGEHLVDAAGLTLYVFALDDGTTTACTDECVDMWPPLVDDDAAAGDGVDHAALATAEGIEPGHVTYHGQLLYYYVADQEPGSILGTQVPEWYALRPDGSAIQLDAPAAGPGGY